MNIKIQSINFTLNKKLNNFLNKKINKLIAIHDTIINADVYLKVDKPEAYGNKIVEINIIIKETLNSSLKKKGKLLFALFCFCTLFIFKCTLIYTI